MGTDLVKAWVQDRELGRGSAKEVDGGLGWGCGQKQFS